MSITYSFPCHHLLMDGQHEDRERMDPIGNVYMVRATESSDSMQANILIVVDDEMDDLVQEAISIPANASPLYNAIITTLD